MSRLRIFPPEFLYVLAMNSSEARLKEPTSPIFKLGSGFSGRSPVFPGYTHASTRTFVSAALGIDGSFCHATQIQTGDNEFPCGGPWCGMLSSRVDPSNVPRSLDILLR